MTEQEIQEILLSERVKKINHVLQRKEAYYKNCLMFWCTLTGYMQTICLQRNTIIYFMKRFL